MKIILSNIKFASTRITTRLDEYCNEEQLKDMLRRILLNNSIIAEIEVKNKVNFLKRI